MLRYCLVLLLSLWVSDGFAYDDELPAPWSEIISTGCSPSPLDAEKTQELWEVFIDGSLLYLLNSVGENPGTWSSPDGYVDANAHIIMWFEGYWYSSPWDYMGVGQQNKHYDAIGDIPEGMNDGWEPVAGETYYFYLSTICRDPSGPSQIERTNVVKYVWFGETGYPPEDTEPDPVEPECDDTLKIVSFDVTAKSFYNHYINVEWNVENAESVTLDVNDWTVMYTTILDGYWGMRVYEDTQFTLTATNECGDTLVEEKNTIVNTINTSWLRLLLGD